MRTEVGMDGGNAGGGSDVRAGDGGAQCEGDGGTEEEGGERAGRVHMRRLRGRPPLTLSRKGKLVFAGAVMLIVGDDGAVSILSLLSFLSFPSSTWECRVREVSLREDEAKLRGIGIPKRSLGTR